MKEEHECSITYDFAIKQVRVYSTRDSIIRGMLKRLGEQKGIRREGNSLFIPMEYCRSATSITRILNKKDTTNNLEMEDDDETDTEDL